MSIKRVSIVSDYPLEGILRENGKKAGVVICHPHPLYGGSMQNNVVDAIDNGFFGKGFTTLRFNFRGVGMSGGVYDKGEGEVKDVIASLAFLKENINEDACVVLAGYSFGAWVASRAASSAEDVHALFLVSYPFAFYSTEELSQFRKDIYFIGGEHDDISPINSLLKFYKDLPVLEKSLKIISTDHFYWEKEKEIEEFIRDNVEIQHI
ncbi:MAG: dienelactone hydrolase family protein [Proteobacteria bacterium]|nr:dienelactone hydrolase family protein [Pseudomonadota bacterium]